MIYSQLTLLVKPFSTLTSTMVRKQSPKRKRNGMRRSGPRSKPLLMKESLSWCLSIHLRLEKTYQRMKLKGGLNTCKTEITRTEPWEAPFGSGERLSEGSGRCITLALRAESIGLKSMELKVKALSTRLICSYSDTHSLNLLLFNF
jgi:hypothetical protein